MSESANDAEHKTASHAKHGSKPSEHGGGHGKSSNHHLKPKAREWYRRPLIAGGIMAGVIVLTVVGVLWWLHSRHYEYTDDAYVDVQSEHVSPRVAGRVLHVRVDDNQDVAAGEVIVELDPADFQTKLDGALADETTAASQASQAQAAVTSSDARVEEAKKNAAAVQATADNADALWRRYESLKKLNPGAVSEQQMDRVTADAKSSAAQLAAARQGITAAEAEQRRAASAVESATAAIRRASALVEQARLNLSYTRVRAGLDGRVAMKTVAAGNYVQPGSELMVIVPHAVYVTANFKETQLRYMRIGQKAFVKVDAYPSLKLQGRVDSVQPGTGEVFSLLPAQNATGNWVKVVQRVPVKIVLNQLPADPTRLAPGMSVEATVTVR